MLSSIQLNAAAAAANPPPGGATEPPTFLRRRILADDVRVAGPVQPRPERSIFKPDFSNYKQCYKWVTVGQDADGKPLRDLMQITCADQPPPPKSWCPKLFS